MLSSLVLPLLRLPRSPLFSAPGFLLCCATLLAGCAPVEPFQNTHSPNSVKVEINGERMKGNWTLYTFDEGATCSGRKVVAGSQTTRQVDVKVDPGRRHSFMLFQYQGAYFCQIAFSFDAKPNNIYGLRVASDASRCYMAALNTTVSIGGVREPSAIRRTIQSPLTSGGSWCGPVDPTQAGQPLESSATKVEPSGSGGSPTQGNPSVTLDDLRDLLPKSK
jgi:hypothetical protein